MLSVTGETSEGFRTLSYLQTTVRTSLRLHEPPLRRSRWDQIHEHADKIHALAKLLELADQLDPGKPNLDAQAVGQAGKMIAQEICDLISLLDHRPREGARCSPKISPRRNAAHG